MITASQAGRSPPASRIDWTSSGGGGISGVSCGSMTILDEGSGEALVKRESGYSEMSSM